MRDTGRFPDSNHMSVSDEIEHRSEEHRTAREAVVLAGDDDDPRSMLRDQLLIAVEICRIPVHPMAEPRRVLPRLLVPDRFDRGQFQFLGNRRARSLALEGNRLAEMCSETLRRLLAKEPVSDRYLLGLVWTIRDMEEQDRQEAETGLVDDLAEALEELAAAMKMKGYGDSKPAKTTAVMKALPKADAALARYKAKPVVGAA